VIRRGLGTGRPVAARRRLALSLVALGMLCPSAGAHPLAPALLELRAGSDGLVHVHWKTSSLRPRGVDLAPQLPGHCEPVSEVVQSIDAQSVSLRWTEDCGPSGLVGNEVGVAGFGLVRIDVILRVELPDGRVVTGVLRGDTPGMTIPERQSKSEVGASYLELGFGHILGGPDHLLFVLGLLLLVGRARPLVKTITAFTLGHSLTLSWVALGFARVPSGPVELGIAASVLMLAVELATPPGPHPGMLRRRPWLMACGFGLLHGLGFAGALAEVGLPQEEIPLALFSFNLGIELGQLVFVGAIGVLFLATRRLRARAPIWLARVPAYGIGCFAAYWCFERAAALF
jgi:hypothetical protein